MEGKQDILASTKIPLNPLTSYNDVLQVQEENENFVHPLIFSC